MELEYRKPVNVFFFKLFGIIIQVFGMGREIVEDLDAKIADSFLIRCQI